MGGCVTAAIGKRESSVQLRLVLGIADQFRVVMFLDTMIIVCAGA